MNPNFGELKVVGVPDSRLNGGMAHDLGREVEVLPVPLERHPERVTQGMGSDALGDLSTQRTVP